jgi:hypothetical protein
MDTVKQRVQEEVSDPSELTPDAFERAAREVIFESETGRFSAAVTIKLIEQTKQFAVYYDGELEGAGFDPGFTSADVDSIFKSCLRALTEIDNDETMRPAKTLFLEKRKARPKRIQRP